MAQIKTSLELVEDTEKTFGNLYLRMDGDAKLANLDPYTLKDADGEKIPQAISVTMNDPAVFLNAIASWIMGAKWQTTVEGEISAKQQTFIEAFLNDSEAGVEEWLSKTQYGKLLPFLASHICARGWIGARRLWQLDKEGEPYLEVIPLDMRYCSYERSNDGFEWVAPRFLRSKSAIKKEYGVEIRGGENEVEVVDWWDGEKEEIWIDKKLVPPIEGRSMPNKHRIGYPPFVISAAPEGFMLLDKGYLVRKGESIFFLDRNLYSEYNRIVSIDQSLAMLALLPPFQKTTTPGQPKSPYPNEAGVVYELPDENKYEKVPQADINMANRTAFSQISGAIQRGGVNNIDLGNLQQPTTAIWITEQTEIRNKILAPRLQAIEDFKEQSGRMDIDQYQKGGFNGRLGRLGKQKQYPASQLGEPQTYTITYKGMSRSKKQEIANMALFNASAGLSLETRLTDILLVDDPQGEIVKIDAEKAEQADPTLFFLRKACSLADEAEKLSGVEADQKRLESMILTERGVALIKQRSQPISQGTPQAMPKVEAPVTNQSLLPLLGERGMRGGGDGQKELVEVS